MPATDSSHSELPRSAVSTRHPPPELARFAVPLAAFAAVRWLALSQADPAGGAESAYLALLVGGVVAAVAAIAPRPAWELGWTALLATTATWIVDYGPHRGALVTAVLAGGLAVAAGRAWHHAQGELRPEIAAPGAIGLQLLMRCDLLLPPLFDLRTLVSLFALPVASALALSLLASRYGHRRALVAGAAAVVLSPGWNVTVTMALVSLAAGAVVADPTRPRWWRWVAAAMLLAPPLWNLPLGLVFAIGGLALAARGRTVWLVPVAAVVAVAIGPFPRGPAAVALFWIQGLVLIPAVVVGPAGGRWRAVHGLVLALAAAVVGDGPQALAGGVALAALGLPTTGAVAQLQGLWSGVLVAGTTLVATYPWMRTEPLRAVRELLGVGPVVPALVAALVAVVGLGLGLDLLRRRAPRRSPRPTWIGGALLVVGLLRVLPTPAEVPVLLQPVILDAHHPTWSHRFPVREVSGLVIDSNLTHSAELPPATVVGTVKLGGEGGEQVVRSWKLIAGRNTGEWAAARPDVASLPGFVAPPPWLSQIAADGTFFAQRFRARFSTPRAVRSGVVTVHRNPELPPEVTVVIYGLELRR